MKNTSIIIIDEISLLYQNNKALMLIYQKHAKHCSFHDFSHYPQPNNINFGNTNCRIIVNNYE